MRTLLVAVAADVHTQIMYTWLLKNEVKPDDRIHILHVAVKDPSDGPLPVSDYFEQAHPVAADQVVQEMLHTRFVLPLQAAFPGVQYVVHIVQASQDNRTVGRIICEKAVQLAVDQVVVGGSSKHHSKLAELLEGGSILGYVQKHCKVPVTAVMEQEPGGAALLS